MKVKEIMVQQNSLIWVILLHSINDYIYLFPCYYYIANEPIPNVLEKEIKQTKNQNPTYTDI